MVQTNVFARECVRQVVPFDTPDMICRETFSLFQGFLPFGLPLCPAACKRYHHVYYRRFDFGKQNSTFDAFFMLFNSVRCYCCGCGVVPREFLYQNQWHICNVCCVHILGLFMISTCLINIINKSYFKRLFPLNKYKYMNMSRIFKIYYENNIQFK